MAPKTKSGASTQEEGEGSESTTFASLKEVQSLRETLSHVTTSVQDQWEKFQERFDVQNEQAQALRRTLDEILRRLQGTGSSLTPASPTEGPVPVRTQTQDPVGSFPTETQIPSRKQASEASMGLRHIASRVGKYRPEQPRKFDLEPGQEPTALQIVTLKSQWKAFGLKQNWKDEEILATILTEGLSGKYFEWANNQEQFHSTQFSSLKEFFQRLAKFHLAEEPITQTLVDVQRARQRAEESPQEFAMRLDGYQAVLKHFGEDSGVLLPDDTKQLQFLTGLQRHVSQQLHTAFMGKALEMDRTTLSILTQMPFARIVQAAQSMWQQNQQRIHAREKQLPPPVKAFQPTALVHSLSQDDDIENFTKRQLAFRQRFLHKILTPEQLKQARELNLCLCRIKKSVVCLSGDHVARDCPLRKLMEGDRARDVSGHPPHHSHYIDEGGDEKEPFDSSTEDDADDCYFLDIDLADPLLEPSCGEEDAVQENGQALSH